MAKLSDPDLLMDRTRAAVAFVNTSNGGRSGHTAMSAFLELFHPDMDEAKRRELVNAARN